MRLFTRPRLGSLRWLTCAVLLGVVPAVAAAQEATAKVKEKGKDKDKDKDKVKQAGEAGPPAVFAREAPLAITLTTNIGQLRDDRADKAPWRTATITLTDDSGKPATLPARAKTHGVWRLKHCNMPPLRLDIKGNASKSTELQGMGEPKIVNFCRDQDSYEQLLLSELQAYRVYHLLTPASHQVRLLRTTYVDSASGKTHATRYSILVEDPNKMAERLGGKMLKEKGAGPTDLEAGPAAIALLFEYMIGNTDFSFRGLHNTELVAMNDGTLVPVVYDFDFSGVVDAPYATVDAQFGVKSVRDRVFRGFCAHREAFPAAAQLFQQKKDAIYALYHDEIGKLMDSGRVDQTLRFFDKFYESIETPRQANRVFDGCVGPH
jgi:hypothetical protein